MLKPFHFLLLPDELLPVPFSSSAILSGSVKRQRGQNLDQKAFGMFKCGKVMDGTDSNSYKDELLVGYVNSLLINPISLISELTSDRSFPAFSNSIEIPLNLGFSHPDPLTTLGLKVEG